MPLKDNYNDSFPPKRWREIYDVYKEHAAWYSGDPERLADCFSEQVYTPTPIGRFWASTVAEERRVMLHVPIAGDLAAMSANLIFSEPIKVKITEAEDKGEKEGEQKAKDDLERTNDILNANSFHNRLLEAAESCSAMGGIYIKINWDRDLSEFPLLSIAQVDTAIPVFKFGFLTEVTFFKTIEETEDGVYWRFAEKHEPGKIYNGLFKGDKLEVGMRVDLSAHPDTADMEPEIDTGVEGLLVRYIPNMLPNRRFRGWDLGQSDYSGIEGLMDALDEAYTSWMRDIRLGKARIMVPESFLERRTNTDGTYNRIFDIDKEVFTTFSLDPLSAEKTPITPNQFEIRTEEHKNACLELMIRIVNAAGYSPQSFGLNITGQAETGTALNIRERRSFLTKSKKERYWKAALEEIIYMMLQIDNTHLGGKNSLEYKPVIEFQDSMYNDITMMSNTVQTLNTAMAASIETKVRMLHPDWDKDQIEQEVEKIKEETGVGIQPPDTFLPETDEFGNPVGTEYDDDGNVIKKPDKKSDEEELGKEKDFGKE